MLLFQKRVDLEELILFSAIEYLFDRNMEITTKELISILSKMASDVKHKDEKRYELIINLISDVKKINEQRH